MKANEISKGSTSERPRADRMKVLLAHDATAPTCDALVVGIEAAYNDVEFLDASSPQDALGLLRRALPDICLICLDLAPAPLAGVRLAQEIVAERFPVVLITRSLRWIPAEYPVLRQLAWVAPEAGPAEVRAAMDLAMLMANADVETTSIRGVAPARRGRERKDANSKVAPG